jgi:hypothetical protein
LQRPLHLQAKCSKPVRAASFIRAPEFCGAAWLATLTANAVPDGHLTDSRCQKTQGADAMHRPSIFLLQLFPEWVNKKIESC